LQCPTTGVFIFKVSLSLQRNTKLCEFAFYCDQNKNSLAASLALQSHAKHCFWFILQMFLANSVFVKLVGFRVSVKAIA
jgi:hypothetical protein